MLNEHCRSKLTVGIGFEISHRGFVLRRREPSTHTGCSYSKNVAQKLEDPDRKWPVEENNELLLFELDDIARDLAE